MTMIYTMIALCGTIFIPFFSTSLQMFVAGGILQGIPWGIFQTLAVTYAAEICPTSLRAYMTSVCDVNVLSQIHDMDSYITF